MEGTQHPPAVTRRSCTSFYPVWAGGILDTTAPRKGKKAAGNSSSQFSDGRMEAEEVRRVYCHLPRRSHCQHQIASISRHWAPTPSHKASGIPCPLDSGTREVICIPLNLHLHTEFTVLNFKWGDQTNRPVLCNCPQTQN